MQPIETSRAHCVDPETLAAWVDGGFPAPAAAEVEVHLSTCARCQAILAALSATEPAAPDVVPAVILPFWSRRPVQWAAAALAAAASISLWTMNRPESDPAPITATESVVAQAPEITAPPPTPPATPRAESRAASKPAVVPQVVVAEPPPASPAPAPVLPAPPPPVPVAAPPPPPQPMPQPVTVAPTVSAARQDAAFSPMAEMAIRWPAFEVTSASDQNAPLDRDALMPRVSGRGGGGGRGRVGNFSAPAARPPVRWRVNGSAVDRSIDGGQTWEPVTLDPPFTLTAGSAPYQNVCWLVGQDGVVFRSTNGTSFERMTPPDTVHLVAVLATDAQRAFVRAVDGRVFDTTDGGISWAVRK